MNAETKTAAPRQIVIFDTTLRDGEQSPGASMNLAEKMEIAHALVTLGVDVIEAGFPIASPGDFEAVRQIAESVRGTVICGLARCREADIDRAWEAVRAAAQPRIHVFLATSAIHREFKLKMDQDDIIRHAVAGVRRAAGYCPNVEFSPEDASRTEADFLCQRGRGGHRRRGHDGEYPRHGRLRHARATWATSSACSATACRTSTRP